MVVIQINLRLEVPRRLFEVRNLTIRRNARLAITTTNIGTGATAIRIASRHVHLLIDFENVHNVYRMFRNGKLFVCATRGNNIGNANAIELVNFNCPFGRLTKTNRNRLIATVRPRRNFGRTLRRVVNFPIITNTVQRSIRDMNDRLSFVTICHGRRKHTLPNECTDFVINGRQRRELGLKIGGHFRYFFLLVIHQ